ncbi:MAG: ABC transporter permease [Dehalococcoidia bacterium]|nr:ABC transporter permease [Dehalococcoidia bacterium]
MQKFFVLLPKELIENWKTHKIVLVFAFCIALGLIVPFMADGNYHGDPLVNPLQSGYIVYDFTDWLSMGMLMLIPFMLMSTVAKEVKDGLAAAVLVKPVGRGAYILAKFLVSYLIFALAVTVGFAICYIYALRITRPWDLDPLSCELFFTMLGFMLLYTAFAVALTIFISTMLRNNVLAGAIAMVLLVAFYGLSFTENIRVFIPFEVVRWGWELVYPNAFQLTAYPGMTPPITSPYWYALWITIGGLLLAILGSILIIRKREI